MLQDSTTSTDPLDVLLARGKRWFTDQGWTPYSFQETTWRAYLEGESGLVNAPTGSGKTYALMLPILLEYLAERAEPPHRVHGAQCPTEGRPGRRSAGSKVPPEAAGKGPGLRAIWITPIRALTREIQAAAQRAATDLGLDWDIAIRSGDTSAKERTRQRKQPPQILITTPESLHLLLASKGYKKFFADLRVLVADEWHELLGSKRGVLLELALSRLRGLRGDGFRSWGISATIGNLEEARDVLLGNPPDAIPAEKTGRIIRATHEKHTEVITLMPDEIERFPWAGHLGISMLGKVIPIIYGSGSTLIFTNTRAQCEIWYHRLLEADPDLAGAIAMHHGSIARQTRDWVEDALHHGTLKAVVCTSSLDLGVDFRPVQTIVQIGSPKGVARFLQRAGRSGHRPGATSTIYFVPTHSLEILEASALRSCIEQRVVESRMPYLRSFDVLVQYLVTLAVSDGFRPETILPELRRTYCYSSISDEEFAWCLNFVTSGGESLGAYDEYHKVVEDKGLYRVESRRVATMHRLSIGAIVSDQVLMVKYVRGGYVGSVEEYFISSLKVGDTFWFAGRALKLVKVQGTEALVRKSKAKKGKIPTWRGGRIQLSSQLSHQLRRAMDALKREEYYDDELHKLAPLRDLQAGRSAVPATDELLIEYFQDREGYHLVMYPCEGRGIHEGMASLFAYRISQFAPLTFTIAVNDYGFELLSDQPIPVEEALGSGLFDDNELMADLNAGINSTEMAKRRFRDIAAIAGLVFKGYPGKKKKEKHLQSSSQLFFDVFTDYEPHNLLLRQAYDEIMTFQLQEARLRESLDRLQRLKIVFTRPPKATPFSFLLIMDRMRERISSEKLADRVKRMKLSLVK